MQLIQAQPVLDSLTECVRILDDLGMTGKVSTILRNLLSSINDELATAPTFPDDHTEDEIHVLWEIDESTGEANGTVHPYCCPGCRNKNFHAMAEDALERGFGIASGVSDGLDSQAICEHCGKPLFSLAHAHARDGK